MWQLWDRIHQSFYSKVKAQTQQLRTELRTLKKGTDTVTEFLNKIKAISDSLMSISEIVTPIDQLDVILEGLPSEYESLVTLINSKVDWFDLDEIKALLLVHEQRVIKHKIVKEVASMNVTQVAFSSNQSVTIHHRIKDTNVLIHLEGYSYLNMCCSMSLYFPLTISNYLHNPNMYPSS